MPYAGELQRNSPFSFQPPDVFSPWVDRCLTKLRLRLKDKGHNASSVRRIVKLLDVHLDAMSVFVLSSAESKVMLGRTCTTADAKAKFLSSTTPEQVRSSISDYDLLLRRWFSSDHLADFPSGYIEIEAFEKCAVLALWKFAAGKESFEHVGATPSAIGLALEGMTATNLALAIHEGNRLLPLEMHHRTQTTKRAVSEVIAAKKAESMAIRSPAAKLGNSKLWDDYKKRAFELACSKPFSSYASAADFIQPALQKELTRNANHRKIGEWIKAMGWRPTKR